MKNNKKRKLRKFIVFGQSVRSFDGRVVLAANEDSARKRYKEMADCGDLVLSGDWMDIVVEESK